jgi:large subunit ribosomal protein L29
MSVKEFNKLNKEQLESKLKDYKDSLVNYRFQKVLQQLENPFDIKFTKRKIATIKTILKEYELGIRKADK